MTDEQIAKLPKHRREWLEIFGNTWKPRKFDGLGCEACVYGTARGEQHSEECSIVRNDLREFISHLRDVEKAMRECGSSDARQTL